MRGKRLGVSDEGCGMSDEGCRVSDEGMSDME